jgi:ribonuclease HII
MNKYYFDFDEIGVDEAGRGPLIGRVYAAAVILGDIKDDIKDNILINDSKKMSRLQREKAYIWIKDNVKSYSIGFAEPYEIDDINILEATRLAMKRAIDGISNSNNSNRVIIDGPRWEKKFDGYDVKSIIKGDSKYFSIASASILAKEEHDKYIKKICEDNPILHERYDLLNNMGYGTKKHLDGIKKYGISEYHRKSFKPCKL